MSVFFKVLALICASSSVWMLPMERWVEAGVFLVGGLLFLWISRQDWKGSF